MPELPEVETLRRVLDPFLTGRRLTSWEARVPRLREVLPDARAAKKLLGKLVTGLRRRAKFLAFDLEGGWSVLAHLGMTGWFRICLPEEAAEPHEHLVIGLDDGHQLRFTDPRRFGSVSLFRRHEHGGSGTDAWPPGLADLGPEPLSAAWNGPALGRIAAGRQAPIKPFLLDQRVVAGIGNIHASESLFQAGIHPETPAGDLGPRACTRLAGAVKRVLRAAIAAGSTVPAQVPGVAEDQGLFEIDLFVYDREGQACRRCGRERIRRIVQAGRSTFFCPRCQPPGTGGRGRMA